MLGDGLALLAIPLLVLQLTRSPVLGADKLIIFFARSTLRLPPAQVGLVVTAGGIGGLLGAAGTRLLCRWLGPVPAVTLGTASSGLALVLIGAATSMPVALAGNLLYAFAIIVASVTIARCGRYSSRGSCWAGSRPPGGLAARASPWSARSRPGR